MTIASYCQNSFVCVYGLWDTMVSLTISNLQAMPVAGSYRLVATAQDYEDGADRFAELASQPAGGYKGHFALTKAGRHTLHVGLACCGGLQASFAFPKAPLTGSGTILDLR